MASLRLLRFAPPSQRTFANIREDWAQEAGRALPVVRRQPAEMDDPPPPSNAAASG